MNIAYTKPSITELEIDYAADAAANGWGKIVTITYCVLKEIFSTHIGTKFGVATSSCTGALTLGLKALGISSGDEVILADTNWIATASPIVQLGAKPVFIDILPETWCIDPDKVEHAITENTKAIIATHIYGNLCDMDALLTLGQKYNLPVIEDAAEAIGSIYKGKKAGSMGAFSAFSFHGTKTLTTGEGGMFLTNDAELYENVLTLSNHGRSRHQPKQFWADQVGFKFKMSNLQAAIGCAQLKRIDELIEKKRHIFMIYKGFSDQHEILSINKEEKGNQNGCWMPTIVFKERYWN